jgi:hypothetical protein
MKLVLDGPMPPLLREELNRYYHKMEWYRDSEGDWHRPVEYHINDKGEYMRYSMLCTAYMIDSSWVRYLESEYNDRML